MKYRRRIRVFYHQYDDDNEADIAFEELKTKYDLGHYHIYRWGDCSVEVYRDDTEEVTNDD